MFYDFLNYNRKSSVKLDNITQKAARVNSETFCYQGMKEKEKLSTCISSAIYVYRYDLITVFIILSRFYLHVILKLIHQNQKRK